MSSIHTLNRLGLCLQKLSPSEVGVPLPANIHPGVFTTLAWDNIDRLEETISGEGTSHRVNETAVQNKPADPQPSKVLSSVDKTKKRSISTNAILVPPQATSVEVDTSAVVQSAREKNLVWIMARMSEQEDQSTS